MLLKEVFIYIHTHIYKTKTDLSRKAKGALQSINKTSTGKIMN